MMGFLDYFTSDLAIDLGTANTLIICIGNIVVDEPSIIAIDRLTNIVIAIGSEAMQMHEKTHENIRTIRPLKDGVIADFHAAEHMIRGMIKMIDNNKKLFPVSHRMVICIPSVTSIYYYNEENGYDYLSWNILYYLKIFCFRKFFN